MMTRAGPVAGSEAEPGLVVVCNQLADKARATEAARELAVPLLFQLKPTDLTEPTFALVYEPQGLALYHTGRNQPGPVGVDFLCGAAHHRRRYGGGKGQLIARALGIRAGVYPRVLDVTAGLGQDGFVLASLGCSVHWLERSPLAYRLLEDGLMRARRQVRDMQNLGDAEACALVKLFDRLQLTHTEAGAYLAGLSSSDCPDVIYLDPMFPERHKSAQVKKGMRAFQQLLGKDEDADELLAVALNQARYRVVVKRPRKAPALQGPRPSHSLEGKSSRFDIYALRKLPERLPDA